jgi:hypothetical protein
MLRSALVLVCLVVPAPVFAQVTVEVVQNGNQSSDPPEARILTVRENRRPPQLQPVVVVTDPVVVHDVVEVHHHHPVDYYDTEEVDDFEEMVWMSALLSFDALDLGSLDLVFEDSEVASLDGQTLGGTDGLEALRIGGGFTVGGEFNEWFRGAELRLAIGGGQLDGAVVPASDGALDVRAESFLSLHAELAAGIHHRFGPFVPFLMGRIGWAAYFVDVAVESPGLGALGTETVSEGTFEAGIETGMAIELDESIRASIAYRGTFVGVPAHGAVLGIALGYGD